MSDEASALSPALSPDEPSEPSSPLANTDAGISQFQRRLLATNWQHLNKTGPGGIGTIVFQKFLSKRSDFRILFQKASVLNSFTASTATGVNSLSDHSKELTDTIDFAISNLKNMEAVAAKCLEQGKSHARLSQSYDFVDKEFWDVFGQSMLEAFTQLDIVRKHKELVRAWMALISFMVDNWRHGYLTGVKRLRLQRATTSL